MGFLDKYSKEEISGIILESNSFAEVLIKMGRSANSGSNRMVISQYVKDNEISVSHFDISSKKRTPRDIFIEHSTASQKVLREHYKDGNYSEYKCAICGLEPFWNNMDLTLTLDHINGMSDDHRLENLRWICPNCDRQLPTYGSRRKKKHYYCVECGKELSVKRKSGKCQECYLKTKTNNVSNVCTICGTPISKGAKYCEKCLNKSRSNPNKPPALELAKMIKVDGFEKVGQKFGVSGNAIKKWCKSYSIPHTKKEIVKWLKEQSV